jgi:N-alpha-acetyltransferase 10/11
MAIFVFVFALIGCIHAIKSLHLNSAYRIRLATPQDINLIRSCNLENLPENYELDFYQHQLNTWPELCILCECENDLTRIAGYALGKVELIANKNPTSKYMMPSVHIGHVRSLAVSTTHRHKNIALHMMKKLHEQFHSIYNVDEVSLYCRVRLAVTQRLKIKNVVHFL